MTWSIYCSMWIPDWLNIDYYTSRSNSVIYTVRLDSSTTTSAASTLPQPSQLLPSTSVASPPPSPSQPTTANDTDEQDQTDIATLTASERAMSVTQCGKISLDPKLAVFTVVGTLKPRVVKLFPTTCSCPAKSDCYHIKAAQFAIGMQPEMKRKQLNLTQLRRNRRKAADKTSGRKRPRLDDVDVVAAGDAEVDPQLDIVAVSLPTASTTTTLPIQVEPNTVATTDDCCAMCNLSSPPPHKSKRVKMYDWVACVNCSKWYHNCCVGVKEKAPNDIVCDFCKSKASHKHDINATFLLHSLFLLTLFLLISFFTNFTNVFPVSSTKIAVRKINLNVRILGVLYAEFCTHSSSLLYAF